MSGGSFNGGSVFHFVPGASFPTTIYSFTDASEGRSPSSLLQASDGNLYGATVGGGSSGAGTLFRLTPAGVIRVLRQSTFSDRPERLVQAPDGSIDGPVITGGFGNGAIVRFGLDGTFAPPIAFASGPEGRFRQAVSFRLAMGASTARQRVVVSSIEVWCSG